MKKPTITELSTNHSPIHSNYLDILMIRRFLSYTESGATDRCFDDEDW